MHIFRGDNGATYEINALPTTSVEQVKDALARASGIASPDQILLCEGTKLGSGVLLQAYGLPSNEKTVFMFDRKFLQAESPPPADVVISIPEFKAPAVPPLPLGQKMEKSPLVWKLMEYENEFLEHKYTAEVLKKSCDARADACKSCVYEQEVQVKGLQVAVLPLNEHHSQVISAYGVFQKYYKQLSEHHESLLSTFEDDMKKLREIRIHHSLNASGMNTLMDVVPEVKLRKWAEECANEHSHMKNRVNELEKQFAALKETLDMENRRQPDVDFKSLQQQLKKAEEMKADLALRLQVFSTDYNIAAAKLQEATSGDRRQSIGNLTEGFQELKQKHLNYISVMMEYDKALRNVAASIAASKTRLSRYVHDHLRMIAALQSKTRDLANKIVVYHEAVVRQNNAFQQLVWVQQMPKAYQSSLEEVIRRRRFGKKVTTLAAKISETLTKMRDEEVARRKVFLDNHGRYIPKYLIPGLNENVPPFEVLVPAFDGALPPVDLGASMMEDDFTVVLPEEATLRLLDMEKENERLVSELKSLKKNDNLLLSSQTSPDLVYKLQADLAQSQESATDYRRRIESLEMKLSSTYSQVERAENLLKHYKEKYETAEKQLENVKVEQLQQSQEATQQLERKYTEVRSEVEELQIKLKISEEKVRDLQGAQDSYEELRLASDQRSKEQTRTIAELKTFVDSLSLKVAEYSAQASQLDLQLETEREEATARKQELEDQVKDLKRELEKANMEVGDKMKKSEDRDVKIRELQSDLEKVQKQLEMQNGRLEAERKEWQSRVMNTDEHTRKLTEELAEMTRLRDELADLLKEASRKEENYNVQLSKQKEDLERIQKSLESQTEEHRSQTLLFQERIRSLESETEELSIALSQKETESQNQENQSARQFAERLQEQIQLHTAEKEKWENARKELERMREEAEQSASDADRRAQEWENRFKNLEEKSENAEGRFQELEEKGIKSKAKRKELREELEKAYLKIRDLEGSADLLRQRSAKLETEKKELNNQIVEERKKSTKSLDDSEAQCRQLKETIQRLTDVNLKIEEERKKFQNVHLNESERIEQLLAERKAEKSKTAQNLSEKQSKIDELTKLVQELESKKISDSNADQQIRELRVLLAQTTAESEKENRIIRQQFSEKEQSFKTITEKYLESVKNVDIKNRQNAELSSIISQFESKANATEKETKKLKDSMKEINDVLSAEDLVAMPVEDVAASAKQRLMLLLEQRGRQNKQIHDLQSRIKALEMTNEQQKEESEKKIQELFSNITALNMTMDSKEKSKLALGNYKPSDYVVFYPNKSGIYEAVPFPSFHFLDSISLGNFEEERKQQYPIVGQIVEISDPIKASLFKNPYKLQNGTEYREVTVLKEQ
eukprot:TRINITY_DN1756_c0_g1_i1.p1 TRINITY_DN1756_c0_g1~~TRINITY_DN1756_c0_g1_i1.p1  ORF type:complete len:1369 (+),score=514.64 TRINITY_DN1756_c0_g1_i1:270-4376(+)